METFPRSCWEQDLRIGDASSTGLPSNPPLAPEVVVPFVTPQLSGSLLVDPPIAPKVGAPFITFAPDCVESWLVFSLCVLALAIPSSSGVVIISWKTSSPSSESI